MPRAEARTAPAQRRPSPASCCKRLAQSASGRVFILRRQGRSWESASHGSGRASAPMSRSSRPTASFSCRRELGRHRPAPGQADVYRPRAAMGTWSRLTLRGLCTSVRDAGSRYRRSFAPGASRCHPRTWLRSRPAPAVGSPSLSTGDAGEDGRNRCRSRGTRRSWPRWDRSYRRMPRIRSRPAAERVSLARCASGGAQCCPWRSECVSR